MRAPLMAAEPHLGPPPPTLAGGFSFFATGPERGEGKGPGPRESCNINTSG